MTAIGVSAASQSHDVKPYDTAYADVEQAFRAYLRDDNHGRGFVLVGHSQGSRMLRALLRRMIDPDPQLRDRLVTAIIPGANATAKDDTYIRGCTAPRQVGCVVAYSTFNDVPPDNTRFGRTDTDPVGHALGLSDGPVLCTDPTELSGDPGHLHSLVNTAPFAPGVIAALLLKLYGGPAPTADTPWLEPQDHYTAKCEPSNGANVLRIAPVGAARHLNPSPDETWGTHLVDVNLPLDNLLTFVSSATRSYLSLHRPLGARILRRRGHRVTVRISGPPWARVRVTLCRNGKMVGRRAARTGRRVVFRHVPRGGRLTVRAG